MPVRRLYQFTFFQINQHECTLNGTYHERTVILIEYQHSADHAGNIESNFQVTKQAVADFAIPSCNPSQQHPSCLNERVRYSASVDIPDSIRRQVIHPHLAGRMDDFLLTQHDANVVDAVRVAAEECQIARLTILYSAHGSALADLLNGIAVESV